MRQSFRAYSLPELTNWLLPSASMLFVFAALSSSPLQTAAASPDTTSATPETVIVITATKTPTKVSKVSSSITVITQKQLEATHRPFVADALRLVPGVYVSQSGGPGTNVDVSLRGGSTGDTLVLIDGVPVNDPSSPDRSYDLSNMTVDNIDRIEIIRGAQSTLYGSNATAGVINIITRRGQGAPITKATFDGGSYSTAEGRIDSSGTIKSWDYSASASQYYTAGFPLAALQPNDSEKDGYRNTTYSGRVDKQINSGLSLTVTGRYARATDHYAGYGSLNNITYIALDDGTHKYDSEEVTGRAQLTWQPPFGRFSSFAAVSSNTLNRDYLDLPEAAYSSIDYSSGPGNYNGRLYQLEYQASYLANRSNLFTAGAETYQERSQYDSIAYDEAASARSLTTGSGYVQDQLTFNSQWFATLGTRLDHHQEFGSKTTYHAGTVYHLKYTGMSFKANYATGFKAPTLYDLYDPSYGNPHLKPETSETSDFGIEQSYLAGRGTVSATYFNDKYLQLFSYNPVTFTAINIGSATANGLEFGTSYGLLKRLNVDFNYTYTRARDENNHALYRRPGDLFSVSLLYNATRALSFDTSAQYVGERNDTNGTAVPVTLPSYTLVNFAANYKVSHFTDLFVRIENLTNADYQEIYSYRTAGRGLYGGIAEKL